MIQLIPVDNSTISRYRLFEQEYENRLSRYTSRIHPHRHERYEDLTKQGMLFWRLICCEGQYVGSVWLEKDNASSDTASLGIFILDEPLCGKGIGREVIGLAISEAAPVLGIRRVELNVRADNPRAFRCYVRCGFTEAGRFTKPTGIEVIHMVKPLNGDSYNTGTPEYFMSLALAQARLAASLGEVPVGAVIVKDGEVIAEGCNRRETGRCATYHAEVMAIEQACKRLSSWRLSGCDLYVTLEPCPMCAGAIINARVSRVFIGALDEKAGAVRSVAAMFEMPFNHRPAVKCGILQEECSAGLADFFARLRQP